MWGRQKRHPSIELGCSSLHAVDVSKNRSFSDTIRHARGWTLDFGQQISHFPHRRPNFVHNLPGEAVAIILSRDIHK